MFRQEHREIRDAILDLIEASRRDDPSEARRLVTRLAMLTGPHFRYEEECMYPALVGFFGPEYVEGLCAEHDAAIGAARLLAELVGRDAPTGADREAIRVLARGLLPHVSDCEGLSIMVEAPPRAGGGADPGPAAPYPGPGPRLLRWADEARLAPLRRMR